MPGEARDAAHRRLVPDCARMKIDRPVRIFVSYAHEDEAWRNALFGQSFSVPDGIRCAWTDDHIQPGAAWDDAIAEQLEAATVAILLVSKYFLGSVYIGRKELPLLLKRRMSDGLKVLWIPIGNQEPVTQGDLAAIQALCSPKKPLAARPNGEPSAVEKAVREIRSNIEAAIDPVGVPLMRALSAKYEPFELLGQTDVAMVYKSRDRELDRPVVIKTPTDAALADPRGLDLFVQNVRDAARIADERNFVALYAAALTERRPYCTMQYIEGQNLRKWITQDNRRPLAIVIRILVKVARALLAAHRISGGYGNLKPSNVMLSVRNEPFILPVGRRVADCRGACALDALERRAPDAEEIAYLPPEQFDDEAESVSPELSDQYMLGLLAYELVSGALPPTLTSPCLDVPQSLALIRSRGSDAFAALPLVSTARPDCSEAMARIIQRMAAKSPDARYPNLAELLADVRRQEDVALARVRESYNRCLAEQAASGKGFFEAVYREFFARRPDAQAMFQNLGARQYEILQSAVIGLFAFYEQERAGEPNEPNVLSQVAQHHDRSHQKIGMDFYAPFSEALVDTACGTVADPVAAFDPKCRGDDATQNRMRKSWQEVLRPGVAYMVSRY